jgi:hypothetical protein
VFWTQKNGDYMNGKMSMGDAILVSLWPQMDAISLFWVLFMVLAIAVKKVRGGLFYEPPTKSDLEIGTQVGFDVDGPNVECMVWFLLPLRPFLRMEAVSFCWCSNKR